MRACSIKRDTEVRNETASKSGASLTENKVRLKKQRWRVTAKKTRNTVCHEDFILSNSERHYTCLRNLLCASQEGEHPGLSPAINLCCCFPAQTYNSSPLQILRLHRLLLSGKLCCRSASAAPEAPACKPICAPPPSPAAKLHEAVYTPSPKVSAKETARLSPRHCGGY